MDTFERDLNPDETLKTHRKLLQDNINAYSYEITSEIGLRRLRKSLCRKLNKVYSISEQRQKFLLDNFIKKIFELQNFRPYFYIETDKLPVCWNRKKNNGWKKDYIVYEWGHIESVEQHPDKEFCISNLCLLSGRCNDKLQCGLDADELCVYGGKLEERITSLKEVFKEFYQSSDGMKLLEAFENLKRR